MRHILLQQAGGAFENLGGAGALGQRPCEVQEIHLVELEVLDAVELGGVNEFAQKRLLPVAFCFARRGRNDTRPLLRLLDQRRIGLLLLGRVAMRIVPGEAQGHVFERQFRKLLFRKGHDVVGQAFKHGALLGPRVPRPPPCGRCSPDMAAAQYRFQSRCRR